MNLFEIIKVMSNLLGLKKERTKMLENRCKSEHVGHSLSIVTLPTHLDVEV